MNISIDTLVKRFETIKSNRCNTENHWQDCADFALPQKAIITNTRAQGEKLNTELYDSTAVDSVPICAAGFHSYLTNPSSRWFALAMKKRALNNNHNVKQWLKTCEEAVFDTLNNSNFNEVITEWYVDFVTFGNACLYEEEDVEDDVCFYARPIKEVYFLVNDRGVIDTVYRSFVFTARQAFQRWGGNAGKKVLDLIEANKVEEPVNFLHIVLPRAERNVKKKDSKNMPFASLYIEPETKKLLSESGYEEFPFFISRFYKVSDSEYAYSPVSMALADIKMLNQMSKDALEGAEKKLHPPIILPHDGFLLPFKTSAKAVNYKLSGSPDDKVDVLNVTGDIGITLEMENQRRQRIERALFVDLFLMLASLPDKDRTATEIMERVNERMAILGPALGRLMKTLSGVIERTFNILLRNGKLPLPPPEIKNQDYKIEYVSPLAKAQRASETKSISDLLLFAKGVGEINPEAIDNVNVDKAMKKVAEITYTSDILRSDEEVQAIRQQRAQAIQMQQTIEQLKTGAEGAKSAIEAEQMIKGGGVEGRSQAGKSA